MVRPINMWCVKTPKGKLLPETLDKLKCNANAKWSKCTPPYRSKPAWCLYFEGYTVVKVKVKEIE